MRSDVLHAQALALGCFFSSLLIASRLSADNPMLHEYFEPEEREDLMLGATTLTGAMPAVIDTPSGVLKAPNARREPKDEERAYGGALTPTSPDATYRIDRNVTRPELARYHDPFNPSVVPYKRLYAFDAVNEAFELLVHDPRPLPLAIGGPVRSGEDQFYGDMVVDLRANEPVRVPSVGPGARVIHYETFPHVDIQWLHDGAENYFVRAPQQRRIRLTVQLAVDRAVFGGDFPDVDQQVLPRAPALPVSVASAVSLVTSRLGLGHAVRPRAALDMLVTHFRGFSAGDSLPAANSAATLYQELTLEKKGVCRHRAYAFVLTALGLGLPARFVRNEAHAWVEVSDGVRWRRIDLGGAASQFEVATPPEAFEHVAPKDPFPWPPGNERIESAYRHGAPVSPSNGVAELLRPSPTSGGLEASSSSNLSTDSLRAERPPSLLVLTESASAVLRGAPLSVAGRVESPGQTCAGLRVDVALRSARGQVTPLGSVPTGSDGSFSGSVTVRPTLELGDYSLLLSTPGNLECGPGHSE